MDIGRDLQKAYDDGYSKAIDDFADFVAGYIEERGYDCIRDFLDRPYNTLMTLAEKMKGGAV